MHHRRALILIVVSALSFALMAFAAKLASRSLPTGECDLEISMPRGAFEALCRNEGLDFPEEPKEACAHPDAFLQSPTPALKAG